ncbi:hypothetical protein PULV_a2422 [Pseudoalteromonas ulvae UL12]|uniref:hypothetical protein n=1 Tax=Pseudoalteromonas ulvae TaxID=107327 RepID=UPI00186BA749|nr:hypothetical protein [Pseudoalteromonas ulvae]MBE0364677.1 hypothetical protein [Pseudoalteromonas ulvae UL12]
MVHISLCQKLESFYPLVDQELFETSCEYRTEVLNLFAAQEQQLEALKEAYCGQSSTPETKEPVFVLGYN